MRETFSNKSQQKPKGLLDESEKTNNFASKINSNKFFESHKVPLNDSGLGEYNFYE